MVEQAPLFTGTGITKRSMGSPWCCWYGPMANYAFPSAFGCGRRAAPPNLSWLEKLLSYARNRLKCKPQFVLFDAWYPSKAWLERIGDYGWYFVCRLKKNRGFEGGPLHKYLRQPYWQVTGFLSGKIEVRVVRYRRTYYATNRLSLTAPEVRQLYRLCQEIEEVIRVLKSQLNLEGCQAGYTRSTEETTDSQPQPQTHHIALCLVAYLIVERERFERGITWRQFKRHLILKRPHTPLPALERLRMVA